MTKNKVLTLVVTLLASIAMAGSALAQQDSEPDSGAMQHGPMMDQKGGSMGGGMMMGRSADANHDGALTQAEFVGAAMQRFDRTDANHDGQITREERQAAFKAMRDEMRAHRHDRAGAPDAPPPPAN